MAETACTARSCATHNWFKEYTISVEKIKMKNYGKTHNYLDISGGEDTILASGGGEFSLLLKCLLIFSIYHK